MTLKRSLTLSLLVLALLPLLGCRQPTPTPVPTPTPLPAQSPEQTSVAPAGGDHPTTAAPTPTSAPAPHLTAGVSGRVLASDGSPIAEALVRADGSEALTDPDGFFDLPEVRVPPSGRLNITYRKEEFATAQEALEVSPGERYVRDALLKRVDTIQEVDSGQNAMIMVADKQGAEQAMLELPAGSLIDAAGNPVSGLVTVEMTHGDPIREPDIFPGEFDAAEAAGQGPTMALESFAFAEVSFKDATGQDLSQLSPDKPATLTVRLPDAFQQGGDRSSEFKPGDPIPWWSYDPNLATWVREDADPSTPEMDDATVVADGSGVLFSEARIIHASWWNADKPVSQSACLSVTVKTPQGNLVQGVGVTARGITYAGGSGGRTAVNGRADFNVKRSDEIAEMVNVSVRTGYWEPSTPDPPVRVTTPSSESSLPDISACLPVEIILEVTPSLRVTSGTREQRSPWFLGDVIKNTIGAILYVNDNDSDNDGKFDLEDDDGVSNELDLVHLRMELKPTGARIVDGTALLSLASGDGKVRVWDSADKSPGSEVSLPAAVPLEDLPKDLWAEGLAGSDSVRDVVFRMELSGQGRTGGLTAPPMQDPAADQVSATVMEIKSVRFEGKRNSLDNDNKLDRDAHPNAPAGDYPDGTPKGMRVFPGARVERVIRQQPTMGNARDTVGVKVTLNVAPPSRVSLYLRSFDVDDPSASKTPVDPNDIVIRIRGDANPCPGGPFGDPAINCYPRSPIRYTDEDDNRGQVNGKKSGELQISGRNVEDKDGIARLALSSNAREREINLKVTRQPGDNFRVMASFSRPFVLGTKNQDNQGHGVQLFSNGKTEIKDDGRKISPVLTVWRLLHVEKDSMAGPGNANRVTGGIITHKTDLDTNTCTLRLTGLRRDGKPLGMLDEDNEFENGTLTMEGVNYPVVFNSRTTVTVKIVNDRCPPGSIFDTKARRFVLKDDDNDSVLPRAPDISLFQTTDNTARNQLAQAYIRPVADGGGFSLWDGQDVAFIRNTNSIHFLMSGTGGQTLYQKWGSRKLNKNDYWAIYVMNLFQYAIREDFDPDISPIWDGHFSSTPSFQGEALAGRVTNMATLAVEAYRDKCGGLDAKAGARSGMGVATLRQILVTMGGMDRGSDKDGGIMTQGCLKNSAGISPSLLNKLRSGPRPGTYESDYVKPDVNRFVEAP